MKIGRFGHFGQAATGASDNTLVRPTAVFLPGASAKVRAQVARELVRVRMTRTETSDIGPGYGWLSVGRMRSKDIYLKARARGACDPRRLSEKNLRFAR